MNKEKRIEEVFKDLCEAPTGCVKDDFTIGTLKETHTDLFIRTVAGHLVSLNYRRQIEAEWIPHRFDQQGKPISWYCSNCKAIGDHGTYCSHCGARMKGAI